MTATSIHWLFVGYSSNHEFLRGGDNVDKGRNLGRQKRRNLERSTVGDGGITCYRARQTKNVIQKSVVKECLNVGVMFKEIQVHDRDWDMEWGRKRTA